MSTSAQIVVLGPHRSGTSAVAGLLSTMGAYFGPPELAFAIHPTNPKGFFERTDVVKLNDELLATVREAWNRLDTFSPDGIGAEVRASFEKAARSIVSELAAHPVSVLKDPRMCLTFALWRPLLPHPICLFVYRNPVEVARSLQKRGDCPLAAGLAIWEKHTREAIHATRDLPRFMVSYEALVADPAGQSSALQQKLQDMGVDGLSAEQVDHWLAPELRHQMASWDELPQYLNASQMDLCNALRDGSALARGVERSISPGAAAELAAHKMSADFHRRMKSELDALREELTRKNHKIADLDVCIDELLNSWRWRLGDKAVDAVRAILLRPAVLEPKEVILKLLGELKEPGKTKF